MASLMYDTALLTSGFTLESPADFAAAVFKMMAARSSEGGGSGAAAAAGGASRVEAEVMDNPNDPWKKKL